MKDISSKIRRKVSRIIYNKPNFETYFNVPIKYNVNGKYGINEKLIEWPFVFNNIKDIEKPKKILDFGCTRSWISLSLASMGHFVYGVDLRDYNFGHPNLKFIKDNISNFEENEFDYCIAISVLEHVGLGAYGERYDPTNLSKVLIKIHELLKKNANFIVTTPVGKSSIDSFERSFSPEEIIGIIMQEKFQLKKENYFKRNFNKDENHFWVPCKKSEIKKVSNDFDSRKRVLTGVNGVGCFVFEKK